MERFDSQIHHRRSIRLPTYDYRSHGAYFVTVCTANRECSLGEVREAMMRLSPAGEIVSQVWLDLSRRFPGAALDAFVVMPNHLHATIVVGAQLIAPPTPHSPQAFLRYETLRADGPQEGAMNRAPTLGECVRALKAASTRLIRTTCDPTFAWQRNYYERVIRNETELGQVRQYIESNPENWDDDIENPHR